MQCSDWIMRFGNSSGILLELPEIIARQGADFAINFEENFELSLVSSVVAA